MKKKEKNESVSVETVNGGEEKFEGFGDFLTDSINNKESIEKAIVDISKRLSLDDKDLVKTLSELSSDEITRISILESVNDSYIDSKLIRNFIQNLLVYRISKERKGREDLKGLIKSFGSIQNEENSAFQRFKMRFGR